MNNRTKLRVLLLQLEFPTWSEARHWSYSAQLAIEEGLHANGVRYLTLTTPWFSRAQEICSGKRFDQVWLEIARHDELDETWLHWVSGLAPVRVGIMPESLEYFPEEYAVSSVLKMRKQIVERRLNYITHVVASDENDANVLNTRGPVPAMWWPQAVPARFISEDVIKVSNNYAVFSGGIYGERASWLEHPDLQGLLIQQASPEHSTVYPALFNRLHAAVHRFLKSGLPGQSSALSTYLYFLRRIRRQCFESWLHGMRSGRAVVNLPSFLKAYAGRVVEGMAAGRPVISFEVPDRPQTKALFEDGHEILLYPKDEPSKLAAQIERIVSDPALEQRIAANARRKLQHFHTVERRVKQILNWIEMGESPTYV